jgi:hypothetical protein
MVVDAVSCELISVKSAGNSVKKYPSGAHRRTNSIDFSNAWRAISLCPDQGIWCGRAGKSSSRNRELNVCSLSNFYLVPGDGDLHHAMDFLPRAHFRMAQISPSRRERYGCGFRIMLGIVCGARDSRWRSFVTHHTPLIELLNHTAQRVVDEDSLLIFRLDTKPGAD